MSNNMAKIADARKTVEQLKLEVNIERMMVSSHIIQCENWQVIFKWIALRKVIVIISLKLSLYPFVKLTKM